MKTVLITGATSGIGKAIAEILVSRNYKLILCGRRTERLEAFKNDFPNAKITTLSFDVRDKEAVAKQIESLPEEFKSIDILINNAGNAHGLDFIQDGSIEDWDNMIDINVKGLLYVSKAIIPGMVDRKSGHIVNIGSIAGKETYPKGNVYCASKYAVDAISEGMRKDLNPHNIKVSQICPGLVDTEFSNVRFKGDQEKAEKVYEGMTPLSAKDIAEIIEFIISRPAHVNIADSIILPTAQASSGIVNRN